MDDEKSTTMTTTEQTTKAFYDEDKYLYATSNVNLRDDYNTKSDVLDVIDEYEKVKLISTNDEWDKVKFNDIEGYVKADYLKDLGTTFVEVDVSDQKLYLYVDDELDYTANVVTGKKGVHDTRLGCNPIYDKEKGRYLKGDDYKVWVERWMGFDGGIGLHDAHWRTDFSNDAYLNGSHGCVNMKFKDVDYVYKNVKVGTNVLVHK